jgi:Amt family ammonium transporter
MFGLLPTRFFLAICSVIFFSYAYSADTNEQQQTENVGQENLIQGIILDLEKYQVELKKFEQLGQKQHAKSQAELEYYKELLQGLTEDVKDSEKDVLALKKSMAELKSTHQGYQEEGESVSSVVDMLATVVENVRLKTSSLDKQKDLIEENSIRLYEVLVDIRTRYGYIVSELDAIKSQLDGLSQKSKSKGGRLVIDVLTLQNLFFMSFAFFIPLAFSLRDQDAASRDIVLVVTISAILGYAILGFGMKYGESSSGLLSFSNPLLMGVVNSDFLKLDVDLVTHFLHRMSFILLPVLIVACIINQQFSSLVQMTFAFIVGAVLIPVFGHWVWGSGGWLAKQNFIDGMGGVVSNLVPAWFACMVLYRRRATWIKPKVMQVSAYSTASALLLLLGWFGLAFNMFDRPDDDIFGILINILFAASISGLSGFAYYAFFDDNPVRRAHRLTGGVVTGLVAIAACAHVVTVLEALSIGFIAGILHNMAISFLRKTLLKPEWQMPVAQLVSIHAVGGIWGALAVALFGSSGGFSGPNTDQIIVQLQGIGVALIYSTLLGLLLGKIPSLPGKKLLAD